MISVFGSSIGEKEIQSVIDCLNSQWLGFGSRVATFEEEFKKRFRINNFLMVDSGSNALYMAVALLDLPKGSKIIIPSFTWISCAHAALLNSHVPIFCDVDIETMNVSYETIWSCMKKNPDVRAIMVIHYAGLAVDIDPIVEIGLPIIEDAAHAVNSTYKGKNCGSLTNIGIYSFDAVKNLTAGEGGGIYCRDPYLLERAKVMRYCGIGKSSFEASTYEKKERWWEYDIKECFIKMLPTNIAASIALVQLNRLDELQARRKFIWDFYQKYFSDFSWIKRPSESRNDRHSYFTYCIRVPQRNKLAHFLYDNGVYTTLRYHPLHLNPIYGQTNIRLPNCEQLNEDGLNIPLHPRLTDNELDKITDLIRKFGKDNHL